MVIAYSVVDQMDNLRLYHVIIETVWYTVMILNFRTDMPGQPVQTQIRLLLEEQSDQGLHCLLFRLHRLDSLLCGRDSSNFRVITTNFLGVRIFRKFTVIKMDIMMLGV